MNQDTRSYFEKRKSALITERATFISHWRELSEYIQPRRGRFLVTDINKGTRRHEKIINSIAGWAIGVATAGILAGIMSPARPWFSLSVPDADLNEYAPVKAWLQQVEEKLRQVFNASNLYRMAPTLIKETLLFGTGVMTHMEDYEDIARFYTHTAGAFMIEQNERCEVDTLYREQQMTVAQIVKRFGLEKCSTAVRTAYSQGNYSTQFPVVHAIEPNAKMRVGNPFLKRFRSVYYEPSGPADKEGDFLEDKGFHEFPAYCLRWDGTDGDTYGTDCPGMTALGDVIGLQLMERRKAQAIDKQVNPPLRGPASLKNVPVASLPGGLTTYDSDGNGGKLEPIYQVTPDLSGMTQDMDKVERRIKADFYVDLFQAITDMEGIQPRNQLDIMQRNEERLLQLGPVLERMHGEFLSPLIDRTFNQLVRERNILPPPPPELEGGTPLKVSYISTLAMAQRSVAVGGIDRLTAYIGGLVKIGYTEAADKFDADQAVDEYAGAIGVPAKLVISDDAVGEKRAQRRQQQQIAQSMEMAGQAANAAKMASDAKTSDPSVLTALSNAATGRR